MPSDNNISCINAKNIPQQISVTATNENEALSGIRKQKTLKWLKNQNPKNIGM